MEWIAMDIPDVKDIETRVREARAFAVADQGAAIGIRMFDGIADLLVEVIRELREIKVKLDHQAGSNS